jgi:hypothetical protein
MEVEKKVRLRMQLTLIRVSQIDKVNSSRWRRRFQKITLNPSIESHSNHREDVKRFQSLKTGDKLKERLGKTLNKTTTCILIREALLWVMSQLQEMRVVIREEP